MKGEASTIQRTAATAHSEACGPGLSVDIDRLAVDRHVEWVLDPRGSSQQKSYTITGARPHYLLWQYIKDASGSNNYDCGWIDYLQWTGATEPSPSADWGQIEYTYDPSGRRIAKDVDGEVTKYLVACPEPAERDGSHCIAEYDANDVLLRKTIYGPGVDQPICMIDVADSNAAYYYYYALGSVVALSNSAGNTVQLYDYDIYGQVAASDPNHPNPFLFTGRRYDTETGLYYYRARYYNPSIGRFLQTDPIGYGDGMNMYAYCGNNPVQYTDPSGTRTSRLFPQHMISYTEASGDQVAIFVSMNIMVLPYRLDPERLSDYRDLSDDWWDTFAFLGFNLGSTMDFVLPGSIQNIGLAGQARVGVVVLYLGALAQMTRALPGVAAQDENAWRGFFEVVKLKKDYKGEVTMERYWVEVCGVKSGLDDDMGYHEPFGYWRGEDAYFATLRALQFYTFHLNGVGMPDAWKDELGSDDYYSGEYIYTYPEDRQYLAWLNFPAEIEIF